MDTTKLFAMVFFGGSIGEKKDSILIDKKGRKLVKTFESQEEAKDTAKRWNKMLSPGEKKYYRMKYSAIKLNPNDFHQI